MSDPREVMNIAFLHCKRLLFEGAPTKRLGFESKVNQLEKELHQILALSRSTRLIRSTR